MSYILDALQRADAERERERGQVPGLRSRAAPLATEPRARLSARWWLPGAGIALVGLLLLTWWWWPSSAPMPATGVVAAPTPPRPIAQEAGPGTGEAGTPPAATPSLPILAPALQAQAPAGPSKQAPRAQAAANTPQPPAASPTPAPTAPAQAAAAPAPAPQEARVPSFGELSADVRARLPQVNVSGATYSANPAHRMLIINGQVVQEGQEIQSGLRLESIGPRSATLDHLGLRYTIGY